MERPWEDKATFKAAKAKHGTWVDMARAWTDEGHQVSETTVRRWADTHKVRHSTLEAKLQKVQDDLRAAKDAAKAAQNETKRVVRESEKLIRDVEAQPRIATPAELVAAERELERARAATAKYRTVARSLARETNIIEEVKEILEPAFDTWTLPKLNPPKDLGNESDDAYTLLLSLNDIHFGELIEPRTVNHLNAYSPNIAARRLEHVVDVTSTWISNYQGLGGVEELVILLNGDNFSGMHNLHPDEAVEYAKIAKQAVDSALIISQAIWELSSLVPRVRVEVPAGDNHTRSTRRNSTSAVALETSWSSIHHELIASLLRDQAHIEFNIHPSYQAIFDIQGVTWAACHGHALKGGGGQLGIPAYALKRLLEASVQKSVTMKRTGTTQKEIQQLESLFDDSMDAGDKIVSHVILGHFHQQFYAQFNGGDVRIAPSLKGADAFALDNLSKYNPAAQTLLAIHPRHDVIADHTINVQHVMSEGDTRYVWGALEGQKTATGIMRDWVAA